MKTILVVYINVGDLKTHDLEEYMESLRNEFLRDDPSEILHYFIPTREGETRIDCVNPKLITTDDYQKVQKVLDENQKIVNDLLKKGHI